MQLPHSANIFPIDMSMFLQKNLPGCNPSNGLTYCYPLVQSAKKWAITQGFITYIVFRILPRSRTNP